VANGTEVQALTPQVAIRERLKPPVLALFLLISSDITKYLKATPANHPRFPLLNPKSDLRCAFFHR